MESEHPDSLSPRPRGPLADFTELLVRPLSIVERARRGEDPRPLRLLAGAILCWALYGAAAGFFQGGEQVLVGALKAPLIVLFSLLLCLPSLYVFSAMAGAEWTGRTFFALLCGFAATLGLVMLALLPVGWLFSLSSRYLASAVFFHLTLWLIALGLAWRFLGPALRAGGAVAGGLLLWLALFCLVSFQSTTLLRPVLARDPGAPLFVTGKKSFFEHLGDSFQYEARQEAAKKKKEEAEAEAKAKAKAKKDQRHGAAPKKPSPAASPVPSASPKPAR
jgi:hypothetical protein